MDLTNSVSQLLRTIWCVLLLLSSGILSQVTDEPSEDLGNYTISIQLSKSTNQQAANRSTFVFRFFGEHGSDDPLRIRRYCKTYTSTIDAIADLGRICSIALERTQCSLEKITITDYKRNDKAVFEIGSEKIVRQKFYQRSEELTLRWSNYSEWQKCNCETQTKTRTRTCPKVPGLCENVVECSGKAEESVPCECENSAEESSTDDESIAIAIIAGIAAILIIVVVVGICYSRRMNKRKNEAKIRIDGNYPTIVITPPEEVEASSPNYSMPNYDTSGQQSALIAPVGSPDDDVIRPSDIDWENKDLYVSADR